MSLHGRALERISPHLHPGARVLALTSDGEGPEALARLLAETGFGDSRLTVLEALGGAKERIRATTAAGFDLAGIAELNVVGVEVVAAPGARIIAYAPGLADDLFEHDGQITKREIRAVTLSSLAPLRGELLWDIGAGSGSVAIEWMLAHPSLRAVGDRGARRPRRAHPAQRRCLRRARARSRGGARAGSARRSSPRPTRSSSAAAPANPACSMRPSRRSGPAGGSSPTP